METPPLSRWQEFYSNDSKLGDIPPSACANQAAGIFVVHNCQIIPDLGCGTGRDSFCLARKRTTVIGLDAARSGLTLAQKRAPSLQLNISWVESDSSCLPFPAALVVSLNSSNHTL